jgi:ribonucleotide monophosphatase NagD (HAD superfamily)
MVDVLLSRGAPGHAPLPGAPPVDIYFSNPDLLWANEFSTPRFGQGAFAACLEALYARVAAPGEPLQAYHFGKPNPEPYRLAEQLLLGQAAQLGMPGAAALAAKATTAAVAAKPAGSRGSSGDQQQQQKAGEQQQERQQQQALPFSAIYAVGDNPAADVRGANAAGAPWVSVLVKTGVADRDCSVDSAQASTPALPAHALYAYCQCESA